MHILLILRGFFADGPGWQVVDTLRALGADDARVSLVALSPDGHLRGRLEEQIDRLGGELAIVPTGWTGIGAAAGRIADFSWFGDVTHLCCHLLRADMVGRRLSRTTGIPCLVMEHGLHAWGDKGPLLRPVVKWVYHRTLHGGVSFGAVSAKVARQLRAEGISKSRVYPVPNGVDLDRFPLVTREERRAARASFSIAEDETVLLGVGGLTSNKNWEVAVEALEPLDTRHRLLLVGEGPERGRLLSVARREGVLERLDLVGALHDVERAFAAADVLVHPSGQESYGRAVVEGIARGLPVAVRAGGGSDAVIPPWPLAVAVDGGNQDTWAAAVTALLDENRKHPEYAAERAIFANEHHDSRRTARALLSALRAISAGTTQTQGNQ